MKDEITIPRALAYRLLNQLEIMAEWIDSERGENRDAYQLVENGNMDSCYYELREYLK